MNDNSTPSERTADIADAEHAEAGEDADSHRSDPQERIKERANPSLLGRFLKGLRPNARASLREDLADALRTDAGVNTAFSPEERAMLHNILRLREIRVEDVMVPRADIDAVDQSTTIGDLMLLFEESGRSRMPVYRENLDDPRGMVHIRDLLAVSDQAGSQQAPAGLGPKATEPAAAVADGNPANGAGSAARKHGPFDFSRVDFSRTVHEAGIAQDVLFVPPSMLASDLMERMQAERIQMALVIDEYGGTDGLVSLEDIVEMVVGDIEDEHDDEEAMISGHVGRTSSLPTPRPSLKISPKKSAPISTSANKIEDVDTLGGLIFSALGRVPARGEVVQALAGLRVPRARRRSAPHQAGTHRAAALPCADASRPQARRARPAKTAGPADGLAATVPIAGSA